MRGLNRLMQETAFCAIPSNCTVSFEDFALFQIGNKSTILLGMLLLCLGNEHSVDLRAVLRDPSYTLERLKQAIVDAVDIKPERHYFDNAAEPQILRFMNMTGG